MSLHIFFCQNEFTFFFKEKNNNDLHIEEKVKDFRHNDEEL